MGVLHLPAFPRDAARVGRRGGSGKVLIGSGAEPQRREFKASESDVTAGMGGERRWKDHDHEVRFAPFAAIPASLGGDSGADIPCVSRMVGKGGMRRHAGVCKRRYGVRRMSSPCVK